MESATVRNLLLMRNNTGTEIAKLKKALARELGTEAASYPLTDDDVFDAGTEAALLAWQSRVGLVADGIAGPRTCSILGLRPAPQLAVAVDIPLVKRLFPYTKTSNIEKNLPYVIAALAAFGLTEHRLVATALGTIRAETEGFVPIAELPSQFNTLPGHAPFSAYDRKLGNKAPGDGYRYRGRGYVQLTGRANYAKFGEILAIKLVDNPDYARAPEVAACLLAAFLDANRNRLTQALDRQDLKAARKVVNGGSHGLERFADTYTKAMAAWAKVPSVPVGLVAKAAGPPGPSRARLNVTPDPADLRDRPYLPRPRSLPEIYPANADIAHYMGAYTHSGLILNQGQEGACTGFGLACVINYLRWRAAAMPAKLMPVSPRMLYHFARRYDEYEGENYEGSSCRGALKGWYHNGVCLAATWPYLPGLNTQPKLGWELEAREHTLGVYYRIDTQAITDLQAAILEVGAIYVSSYTHPGWERLSTRFPAPNSHKDLPVIDYDGRPSREGGHAYALVGFNRDGFIIQNSWGTDWGAGGFGIISYEDWLAHAMDAWVAAMGVPGVVSGRLAVGPAARPVTTTGAASTWWDEDRAYRHSILLGNNGRVERFDNLDAFNRNLMNQACVLPDTWFRQNQEEKKRLVVYVHGGLNSEADAIQRVRAMGRYFLGNGCYPLFLVWKTGILESLVNIIKERIGVDGARKAMGVGGLISDTLSDPLLETTIARPFARPLWSEMKENAELAADSGRGCDLLTDALRSLRQSWNERFELHLIGHSAGSIMLGRLLGNLAQKDLTGSIQSLHLYAPACSVAFANRYYAPQTEVMRKLYIDILADKQERDDNVGYVYRKSLLYLVCNALEADRRTPILGLANVFDPGYDGWDGSSTTTQFLANWRDAVETSQIIREGRLKIHPETHIVTRQDSGQGSGKKTEPATHGGFDNNVEVVGETLKRITGATSLPLPVEDLVGF